MHKQFTLLLCLATLALTSGQSRADKTYVYKESDGTVWFTNVKPSSQDSTRYKLIEVKGREPATKSCRGMNERKLGERAANYQQDIAKYAGEFGIDAKLVMAVIRNESCFDKAAVSSAGAEGLMQLMPATATSLGVIDSFSPQQNIRGGTQYLAELIKRYNNNLGICLLYTSPSPRDRG